MAGEVRVGACDVPFGVTAGDESIEWTTDRAPTFPSRREVHVWRAELDVEPEAVGHYYARLRDDERERADRFRFEVHRRRYVVSRAVLRVLLANYTNSDPSEIALRTGEHGKPGLIDPAGSPTGSPLEFNLSHAGGLAVYAFAAGRRVGIDVEEESRDVAFRDLASRFFSEREQKVLESVADGEEVRRAFYACWTRKEAYIKALGEGVTHGLDNFSVAFGAGVPASILHSQADPDASTRWSMRSFSPAPGFAGAIVVEGSGWTLHGFELPGDRDVQA